MDNILNKDPFLLSICIPTFNQSMFLEQTIQSIVDQDEFKSGKVQICISDNASTDNTEDIIKHYKKRFPHLVKCIRQEANIVDENFKEVLKIGDGQYLKLSNSSLVYEEGSLAYMISQIETNQGNIPLFFFGESSFKCDNLDEFLRKIDYWVTWIGLLGLWRRDLAKVLNKKSSARNLWQVEVVMSLVQMYGGAEVKKGNLTRTLYAHKNYRGNSGYNFNEVFINEYLYLISSYLHNNKIKKETFNILRRNILYEHCAPSFAVTILSLGKRSSPRHHLNYLWRWYYDKPHYLIAYLLFILLNLIKIPLQKILSLSIKA